MYTSTSQIMWQGSGPWLVCTPKWAKKDNEFRREEFRSNLPFLLIKGILSERPNNQGNLEWEGTVPSRVLKFKNIIPIKGVTQEAPTRKTKNSERTSGYLDRFTLEDFCLELIFLYKFYTVFAFYTHMHICTKTHINKHTFQLPLFMKTKCPYSWSVPHVT